MECNDWRNNKLPRVDPKHDQFVVNISENIVDTPIEKDKSEKVSYGIACCRIKNGRPEILMICKRNTYAYRDFVHGNYNCKSATDMIKLFSEMTLEEKIEILSLNFGQMWYRAWFNQIKGKNYFISRAKFHQAFMEDGGRRLKHLISKSTNSKPIWEIPKGKKNRHESDIVCAMREFYEETGISKQKYKLFPLRQNTYTYIDAGIRYRNVYYAAICEDIAVGVNSVLQEQLYEISDCRWMNLDALRQVDCHGRLVPFVKHIFNFIKKC